MNLYIVTVKLEVFHVVTKRILCVIKKEKNLKLYTHMFYAVTKFEITYSSVYRITYMYVPYIDSLKRLRIGMTCLIRENKNCSPLKMNPNS